MMETLEYKVIKNRTQYNNYCRMLEELCDSPQTKAAKDKIELLTLLIETWDKEHNTFEDADPVELLEGLMEEHGMKAVALAELLGVSKGLVSDILNYKKGFSKEIIRKLADRFKVRQEAFNREYELKSALNVSLQKAVRMQGRIKSHSYKRSKRAVSVR